MRSSVKVKPLPVAVGAVVLVGLLAGACSGDGRPTATEGASPSPAEETMQPVTAEDFVAEADAICTESARAIEANQDRYSRKTSAKESISIDQETWVLAHDRNETLAALSPPEEVAGVYDRYLAKREVLLATSDESLQARRDKEMKRVNKLAQKQDALLDQVNELGRSLGFYACANTLPRADEREVKDNVVRYFKNPDRATCKALSSTDLLKVVGGLEKCVDRLAPSKKVRVHKVEGAAGVRASAEITADAYPDVTIFVGLVYENGTYQIDRYESEES